MGLTRTWKCDRCSKGHVVDPISVNEQPPSGWQVIPFNRGASVVHVLLCPDCMAHLYAGFMEGKSVAPACTCTAGAAYRRAVLETFDVLANYLDNPELRQIHTFAQRWQDGDFDPAELLSAWVNDPDPLIGKEFVSE